jgi:predicted permease
MAMRWMQNLVLRFRSLFRRDAVDREMEQELRFHLEQQIAAHLAAGMPPAEARYAAIREFGGVEQIREECRDTRRIGWIQDFLQDVRFGMRMLRKTPGFALIALCTLALGIGANTAIFSFMDGVLLRALPVSDPHSLVLLQWSARGPSSNLGTSSYGDCRENRNAAGSSGCTFSEPLFHQIQSQGVFSEVAAFAGGGEITLTGNGAASTVDNAQYISGRYFQTLGVRPQSGRLIGPADEAGATCFVAVLSYSYWRNAFASDPSAVGKTIFLNRVAFAIIGVAEPRFDTLSPGRQIQMWLPLSTQRQVLQRPWDNRDVDPNNWWLVIVARSVPGKSRRNTQAALNVLFQTAALRGAKPVFKPETSPQVSLVPAESGLTGFTTQIAVPIYLLMLAVGVVLLIACANVAGLLLSRAAARHKEMAVRFALGARRGRIVRQLLTESLLLSISGGGLGLFFARWIMTMICTILAGNEDFAGTTMLNSRLDGHVLLFTGAVSLLSGILFGLAPALRGMRVDLTPALKDAAGNLRSGRPVAVWFSPGNTLVVTQVALTVIVLAGAGLLVRTLQNLRSVDPGFNTRNILTFRIDPTSAGYKRAAVDAFYNDLQARLAAVPGVGSVSYSWIPLLSGGLWTTGFRLPGKTDDGSAKMLTVGMDFFHTFGIPLRRGREFMASDFAVAAKSGAASDGQQQRVAANLNGSAKDLANQNNREMAALQPQPVIVNETLLRKYFPNTNPIGLRFGNALATDTDPFASSGWEIVGVVGDAKYEQLRGEIAPTIYAPFTGQGASFALRTAVNPSILIPQIRSVVAQLDASLPLNRMRTESQEIESQLMTERLIAKLSAFFGALALLLSCIGLYGLLAYEVARRTREIGIRVALGARSRDVLRLVIGQALALVAAGAAVGIAAALGVTRFLGALLYGVKPTDPVTFTTVVFCLVAIALLACYIPARRAMQVDPMVALRHE